MTAYSQEQVNNSLQIIDVLSNGNLLCSIVESKKDYENNNVVPFEKVAEVTDSEYDSPAFESLAPSEKSKIVRAAAEHLFSKDDVDKAIKVIDELLDSSDPSKHNITDSDAFDVDKWKEIRKHVTSIKSHLHDDALETTKN